MITANSTKYGGGITLFGDTLDMQTLHETIHYLAAENGPIDGEMNEFLLAFAYEVRHANQGERKFLTIREDPTDKLVYRGMDLLWPTFLVQLGMLRNAAAYLPTTREHQAILFQLEFCTEQALTSFDAAIGKECFSWYLSFMSLPKNYFTNYLSQAAMRYVHSAKSGKARFRNLPSILYSISPLSHEYKDYEREVQKVAKEQNCDAHSLWDLTKWPEFKL